MIDSLFRPRLACKVNFYPEQIVFTQGDRHVALAMAAKSSVALEKLFLMMDGTQTVEELQQQFFPQNPQPLHKIIGDLDRQGLIDDTAGLQFNSGTDTVRQLQAFTAKITQPIAQKLFWQQVATTEGELAIKVLAGWMREYYFYLTQQCCFTGAVLSFSSSSKIRQLINQHYCRQQGQDAMLLEALNAMEISQEELRDTIPLPQTTALVNGLTYWANFEPLFFLTTLESLTRQKQYDLQSCLQIGKQIELASTVVEPIQRLHDLTLEEPKNLTGRTSPALEGRGQPLTSLIFAEIPHLEAETKQRWQGQIHLFGEMQDNFYRAIGDYYSSSQNSGRRVEFN